MRKLLNPTLAGIAFLVLPLTSSPAGAEELGPAVAPYASEVPSYAVRDDKAGTFLDEDHATLPIAQTVDYIVDQYLQERGGYEGVKRILSLDSEGARYVGCDHYALHIHMARPNTTDTLVKISGSLRYESRRSGKTLGVKGGPVGLGVEEERALLRTFDFDGAVVDWKSKHYTIKRLGMEKLPGVLTWKLKVDRPDGYRQILHLDSHYGDVVKELIMNTKGVPVLEIVRHDFRPVEGLRFPFAVDYKSPNGEVLASDRLVRIEVKRKSS